MTFKSTTLPCEICMTFDNDEEVYEAELVEIVDVNEENDTCVLMVDGLTPQIARLKVPYHMLDGDVIDCGTAVKLSLKK